jgi:hypothetical protein
MQAKASTGIAMTNAKFSGNDLKTVRYRTGMFEYEQK